MASYELIVRESVAKDLRALPNADVARILERIRALAVDPRPAGCEKLSGQERYRVRQGVYRIVYEIQDQQLIVVAARGRGRLALRAQRGRRAAYEAVLGKVADAPAVAGDEVPEGSG